MFCISNRLQENVMNVLSGNINQIFLCGHIKAWIEKVEWEAKGNEELVRL